MVSVWFAVKRLDLNVSGSPIESDRFKQRPICLQPNNSDSYLTRMFFGFLNQPPT
ncbi:hypothetical protein PATSB16_29320 [Pandoraea thiooxydans]|nr:hypothetical protein PATSB16_29320 [Pandoraea thiooxydans]